MFWLITQNGSDCDYYSGFFLFFSIHGNHDDPCGLGGFCSLDNLHTAGLINYFGRQNSLKGTLFQFTHLEPFDFRKEQFCTYQQESVKF